VNTETTVPHDCCLDSEDRPPPAEDGVSLNNHHEPSRAEDGFSLIEMTVTVAILGLVIAVLLGAVAAITRTASGAERRMQNLEQARVVMGVAVRDLRMATPVTTSTGKLAAFATADPTEAVFYANLGFQAPASSTTSSTLPFASPPVRVRLFLETDQVNAGRSQLVEEVTRASISGSAISWPQANTRRRVVGTALLNSSASGNELFCYGDDSPATTGSVQLGSGQSWCQQTTPAPASIAAVQVQLIVQQSSSQGPTTLTTSVSLPNVAADKVIL
jgi:prepilin-type N-terminal cleavage/methylation domain-containing protein